MSYFFCMIQIQIHGSLNVSELVKLSVLMFWSIGQVFVLCDFSERVTAHFDRIDLYNQCDWYAFPKRVRGSMQIVIAGTQQSIVMSAIGNLECTRETFKKVSLIEIAIIIPNRKKFFELN